MMNKKNSIALNLRSFKKSKTIKPQIYQTMKKFYSIALLAVLFSAKMYSQCNIQMNVQKTAPSCNGACDAQANVQSFGATAPNSYSWSTTPLQITQLATGLCAGTYTVMITDSKGCTATRSTTINNTPLLKVTAPHTNPNCAGGTQGATATANPTGGTGPYTYSWSTNPTKTTKPLMVFLPVYILLL